MSINTDVFKRETKREMGEMERNIEHQRKNVTIPEEYSQIATLSGEEMIECECRKNGTNTEHINICGRHDISH